jgi:hypothetical protein
MVNEYFGILRRLVGELHTIEDTDLRRQQIALCIFQSVTAVETFLNLYLRVIVSEKDSHRYEEYFLKSIDQRKSLAYKLKNWTKVILNRKLTLDSVVGKKFVQLKDRRNSLMHFVSTHETIAIANRVIHGSANMDPYESLTLDDAYNALETAEDFLAKYLVSEEMNNLAASSEVS